jgi:hypothetical protein
MRIDIDGYISISDDNNYSMQCIIDDIKEQGVNEGYVEQYPFYAVNFKIIEEDLK